LWSARLLSEAPERIRAVHAAYYAAGADVAITASYQASFDGFAKAGLDRAAAAELMRRSVGLACEARDAFWSEPANRVGRVRPLVAASIGSYGAYLADGSEYRGNYGVPRKVLKTFHRPRLEVLAGDAGVDVLAVETIPSAMEAEVVAELLREYPGVPTWMSFCCRDEARIAEGALLRECVAIAESADSVVAIGVNCTAPRFVSGLLREARDVTRKFLVAYPNLGETWDAVTRAWTGEGSEAEIVEMAQEWFGIGARLIGGCCRTGPGLIAGLRSADFRG
jgi:homocysteine S-methyltransferase